MDGGPELRHIGVELSDCRLVSQIIDGVQRHVLLVRKRMRLGLEHIADVACRAGFDKRSDHRAAERSRAARHHNLPAGKIHRQPLPRLARVGSTWNSSQFAISPVRSFLSSTLRLMPCRHDSRLSSGLRPSASRSQAKVSMSAVLRKKPSSISRGPMRRTIVEISLSWYSGWYCTP